MNFGPFAVKFIVLGNTGDLTEVTQTTTVEA
jgi:hypothetical protein